MVKKRTMTWMQLVWILRDSMKGMVMGRSWMKMNRPDK